MLNTRRQDFVKLFKDIIADSKMTKKEITALEKWFLNMSPHLTPVDVEILMRSIMDHFRCRVASGDLKINADEAIHIVSRIWQKVWRLYTTGEKPLIFPEGNIKDTDIQAHFRQRWTAFNNEIKKATRSIDIAVYNLTDDRCRDLLIQLARNGVTIRIFSEGDNAYIPGSDTAILAQIDNIEVRFDQSATLMHHKFAIIDQQTVLSGSMNFSNPGFSGNKENFLVARHADVASVYTEEFELLWSNCNVS